MKEAIDLARIETNLDLGVGHILNSFSIVTPIYRNTKWIDSVKTFWTKHRSALHNATLVLTDDIKETIERIGAKELCFNHTLQSWRRLLSSGTTSFDDCRQHVSN